MDARAYPLHGSLHRTYLEHDWLTIDGPALRHPGELAPRLVLQKGAEPCAAVAGLPAVADIHAKALHRSLLARPASCTPRGTEPTPEASFPGSRHAGATVRQTAGSRLHPSDCHGSDRHGNGLDRHSHFIMADVEAIKRDGHRLPAECHDRSHIVVQVHGGRHHGQDADFRRIGVPVYGRAALARRPRIALTATELIRGPTTESWISRSRDIAENR